MPLAPLEQASASSGLPLPEDTSAYLGAALGADLSDVRLHADGDAAAAADAYQARAFTHGRDIYFAHGEYDPDSASGRRLLYHEVAHTVQQADAAPTVQGKLHVSQPGDASEREADRVADALVAGEPVPRVERRGAGMVLREAAEEQEPALSEEIEARVRELLELPVQSGDANAAAARRPQLVQCFRGLDAQSRKALLSRLQRRGDPLGSVFHYRLATATRNALLEVLRTPTTPVPENTAAPAHQPEGRTDDASRRTGGVAAPGASADDTWNHLIGEASTPVGKFGRVKVPRGLRLRSEPHAGAETTAIMPLDTLVRVERKTSHGWAYVIALGDARDADAVTGQGFCEYDFLMVDPPEPGAHLHYVQGEMPKDIAARYYKGGGFDWGADARLFVEAIWEANKGCTSGVYRQDVELSWAETAFRFEEDEETLRVWKSIGVRDGHAIWIPSRAFVTQLKAQGAISSGSMSYEAWQAAKSATGELIDWAEYGAGFVVGLLKGAYGSVRDLVMGVVDLAEMIYDVVKTIIQEGFVDACQSFGKKVAKFFEDAPETLASLGKWFADEWTAEDAWDRGLFQGEVIGYVAMMIVITLLTMGGGTAAQAGGKFGQVVKLVRALDAAGDITAYAGKLKRVVRVPDKVTDALDGTRKVTRGADVDVSAGGAGGRGPETGTSKDTDVTPPTSGAQGKVHGEAPLALGTERHTVKLQEWNGELRIILCSDCGPILKAFDDTIADFDSISRLDPRGGGGRVGVGPQKSLYNRLVKLRAAIAKIEADYQATRVAPHQVQERLNEIATHFQDLTKKFPEFDASCIADKLRKSRAQVPGGSKTKPFLEAALTDKFEVNAWETYINTQVKPGEKIAVIREVAKQRARKFGWDRARELKPLNRGAIRDIYRDPNTQELYSVDIQHGRFEWCNRRGRHQDELDFNLNPMGKQDTSGRHDIRTQ